MKVNGENCLEYSQQSRCLFRLQVLVIGWLFLHYSTVFYFWIYSTQFSPPCLRCHCLNLLCEIHPILFLQFCSIYSSFRHIFCLLGPLYIPCSVSFVLGTPYFPTRFPKATCKPQDTNILAKVMNKQ